MGSDSQNYVWQNAPVIEIGAEVHWRLQTLEAIEGAAIDPFFDVLLSKFSANVAAEGFSVIEQRVPSDVPRELLAHRVTRLFRKSPQSWPVMQIGPGVFTANIVPPYKGWQQFRGTLSRGLKTLFHSHPVPEYMDIEKIFLKYINIFDESHGVESPREFIREKLELGISLPQKILELSQGGADSVHQSGLVRFPVKNLKGAEGKMNWREVVYNDKPGVNVDITVEMMNPRGITGEEEIIEKFDKARDIIFSWFHAITEKNVQQYLGEKKSV